MATTESSTETEFAQLNDIDELILDAIQKGYDYVADVLDYCGPQMETDGRGLDSTSYMQRIDRLIDAGYIERAGERFDAQLELRLTEMGEEAAPELSELEQELLEEHGITVDALDILTVVVDFEQDETGERLTISQLQGRHDDSLSAYQYTLAFNSLVDAGLARERGIFRYRIEPTDAGRELVDEYAHRL